MTITNLDSSEDFTLNELEVRDLTGDFLNACEKKALSLFQALKLKTLLKIKHDEENFHHSYEKFRVLSFTTTYKDFLKKPEVNI